MALLIFFFPLCHSRCCSNVVGQLFCPISLFFCWGYNEWRLLEFICFILISYLLHWMQLRQVHSCGFNKKIWSATSDIMCTSVVCLKYFSYPQIAHVPRWCVLGLWASSDSTCNSEGCLRLLGIIGCSSYFGRMPLCPCTFILIGSNGLVMPRPRVRDPIRSTMLFP